MLIGFKYKLSPAFSKLARQEIPDLNEEYINGWLDSEDANQLYHCSMYMICEQQDEFLSNPLAIIARNSFEALQKFYKATEKNNGTVVCEILNSCEGVKVNPTGTVLK